jgi:hypothetical protein
MDTNTHEWLAKARMNKPSKIPITIVDGGHGDPQSVFGSLCSLLFIHKWTRIYTNGLAKARGVNHGGHGDPHSILDSLQFGSAH